MKNSLRGKKMPKDPDTMHNDFLSFRESPIISLDEIKRKSYITWRNNVHILSRTLKLFYVVTKNNDNRHISASEVMCCHTSPSPFV